MKPASSTTSTRTLAYAGASVLLGLWAFVTVNSISGPAFEPILNACTNPDYATVQDFVAGSGYHEYDPYVGLKAFDWLVCLITQFLLELRETDPQGILVWGSIVVVSMPLAVLLGTEGGRAGVVGPVRYPVLMGLLIQIFGISVVFPVVSVPSLLLLKGKPGAPLTTFRLVVTGLQVLPASLLTLVVFFANDTNSRTWTTAAGMLGGPLLAMIGLVLFRDESISTPITKETTRLTLHYIQSIYQSVAVVAILGWFYLVFVFAQAYDVSFSALWKDVWVEANASVAFMTVDTCVLFLAVVLYVSCRCGEFQALKTVFLSAVFGPGAAICLVLLEEEKKDFVAISESIAKKDS